MISSVLLSYLMVAIATMRYCSGVDHIPVVIFGGCCVDSLMFTRSSVFPREEVTSLYHRARLETLSLFLGGDILDN